MADVSKLFGITAQEVDAVKAQGIETVEAFYEVAKHPGSRADLAGKTGIDGFRLEELSSIAGNFILMMDCSWDDDDE
ncbi:MAG: DUF4332 domain-containing protein [Coriobacteriales bacterium]